MNEQELKSHLEEQKSRLKKKLDKTLKEKGISQRQLAERMGISRGALNSYLGSNYEKTSITKFMEMLLLVGIKPDFIFITIGEEDELCAD